MYGKKRITITNKNFIVLAGGKSYIPIGRFKHEENYIIGRLRNVDCWETILTDDNSIEFKFCNTSQLRDYVKEKYVSRL